MQAKSGGSDRAAIQAGYVYIRATSAGRQTVSHSRILLHPLSLSLCRGKERERERKKSFLSSTRDALALLSIDKMH